MEKVIYPLKENWEILCRRPHLGISNLDKPVIEILERVRTEGDNALRYYSKQFDRVVLSDLKASESEILESESMVPGALKKAIETAANNIKQFHVSQAASESIIETMPGVRCWRKNIPIEKVGLYVPGGSAPLFSTVLMLGIPAKIAGCRQIIVCTPPGPDGRINPVVLYAALQTGLTDIYKIGGAQAIAAMAYGTETVPAVNKIFGPGNQFVTKAKEIVQAEGTAIDMPAGPSEVLVIADSSADPSFVAADLLSQAEHGPDSQVILVTDSSEAISNVCREIDIQLDRLPRRSIAGHALLNSLCILMKDIGECLEFSNMYAPEHLILNTVNACSDSHKVINAGSVFIGKYSCESVGDYASGTNHTLPTNGFARTYSGVSVDSFVKKITFQELTDMGLAGIAPAVEAMAEAEQLEGHRNAVRIRIKEKLT